MKKLEMNQMEKLEGGVTSYDYCTIIQNWISSGGDGYQGDFNWLVYCWDTYC